MLFKEIIPIYSENDAKPSNKNEELLLFRQVMHMFTIRL
jgi:hypothetical protein